MATRFKYNPTATAQLARTVEMVAMLKERADEGADAARSIAPVRTGEYQAGIEGDAGIGPGGFALGRLNAHDFKSHWIEFGTSDTPTFGVLRRAIESVGLRLRASGLYR